MKCSYCEMQQNCKKFHKCCRILRSATGCNGATHVQLDFGEQQQVYHFGSKGSSKYLSRTLLKYIPLGLTVYSINTGSH